MLWDVGGVLVHLDAEQSGRRRWRERLGLVEGELDQLLWAAIGSAGRQQTSDVVERLARACDVSSADAERLLIDAHDHWRPNTELLELARSLKDRGIATGIVGNAGAAARWAFEALLGVDELADVIVISAEVGVEKPDPTIYRLALTRLDVAPAGAVFVDDLVENVEGAARLGIDAIHHTSNPATIAALTARYG